MGRRARRTFTKEYKAEVVGLVRQGDKTIGALSSDLGLTESAVRNWVAQAEIDAGKGTRVRSTHTDDSWDRKTRGRAVGSPGRVRRWAVNLRRKASMALRSAMLAADSNVTRIESSPTVT